MKKKTKEHINTPCCQDIRELCQFTDISDDNHIKMSKVDYPDSVYAHWDIISLPEGQSEFYSHVNHILHRHKPLTPFYSQVTRDSLLCRVHFSKENFLIIPQVRISSCFFL